MDSPEVWRIAFDRLYQLGSFDEARAEIGYDPSRKEVVPEPVVPQKKLTVDDLESIGTTTREGARLARQIVADAVFGDDGQARQAFQQFVAHVARAFGHNLTEDEQREIINWFQKNNRSFLSNSYDQCRVNLVKRGILPATCLTEEEVLEGSIENVDTQSWEGRRRLKQQILAQRRQ